MKKFLAVIAAIALFGGWYYASPWWTLKQMRDAAQSRDAEKISAYVDYPALREDLNGELSKLIKWEQQQPDSGLKRGRDAFAASIVGSMFIDSLVSPKAVQALFRLPTARGDKPATDQPQSPMAALAPGGRPVIERVDLNEFQVRPKKESQGALVFRRSGLGWKFSAVQLPER